MISDFTPDEWATLEKFQGWKEYFEQKPMPVKISDGHYWDCFTIKMLLRDQIDEFPFSHARRAIFQTSMTTLDLVTNDAEEDAWRETNRKEMDRAMAMPHDYGVCDSPEQVLEHWPELATDPRRFVILFDEVRKDQQDAHQGWRWHKWGEYIGTRTPECEYLYDEGDAFESVLIFNVCHLKNPA